MLRFTPEFLDEIRARLPVSDVVGRRVKLKKQGREWAGLSPFNKEKTASFFVNDVKGFYHCFSSGKHGDIFRFLMETEGVSFPEAVERLALQAGLDVPKSAPQEEQRAERKRTLVDVMEMATKYFEAALTGRAGTAARAYLDKRGLTDGTRSEFRLGYAPADRNGLKAHLLSQNIAMGDLIETGLVIHGEDIPEPYDR